jgi:hypothetical protein
MARHLRLVDFRDLDLMLTVAEHVNAEGFISTDDLATELGFDDDHQAVGARMGWMRRYGVFERHEGGLWRLTRAGERVLLARKQAAALESVADVPDGALVDVMAHVTSRYRRGDPLMATLLRREFEFGTRPGSVAYQQSRRRRRR